MAHPAPRLIIMIAIVMGIVFPADAAPQRIVSTLPSNTEILYELGLGDQIVGVTDFCDTPTEARTKTTIGGVALNYEKIVALQPTLIVMGQDAQGRDVERLKGLGLPVLAVRGNSLQDVSVAMTQIAVASGRIVTGLQRAVKLTVDVGRERERAKKMVGPQAPAAFVQIWHRPLMTATPRSLVGDILQHAGLRNIAEGAPGPYPLYSLEKLLAQNPRFIVVPVSSVRQIADISLDPLWQSLDAVKNRRLIFVDENLLVRAGPRAADGLKVIVHALETQGAPSGPYE